MKAVETERANSVTIPEAPTTGPLLNIRDLRIEAHSAGRPIPLVDGVSFSINRKETVALVGESGCGKSMTSLAILRLLSPGIDVTNGNIEFLGQDLLALDASTLRTVRGNKIAMIFQEPMSALNPVLRIGEQIAEPLRMHKRLSRADARRRAIELLGQVGIGDPASRVDAHPHELSGGMRQRVMIACAISCEPQLLIADEPTTALDVTVQAQIMALLRDLRNKIGMGVLFVTHDLALVSEIADRVCVMYAGRIVESGTTRELLTRPRHPYTQALLRSIPQMFDADGIAAKAPFANVENSESGVAATKRPRLPVIPGEVARPGNRPSGCAFHPRCEVMQGLADCVQSVPPLREMAPGRQCACWRSG